MNPYPIKAYVQVLFIRYVLIETFVIDRILGSCFANACLFRRTMYSLHIYVAMVSRILQGQ